MKLVKGSGAPGKGACYMSALNYYVTNGATWSDQPECVSPVIRALAIRLNDSCVSDEEREELIGPHLFDPVGTAGDLALDRRRAFLCADMACRVWVPRTLEACGFAKWAEKLRALDPVIDRETANAARSAYAAAGAAADAGRLARVELRDFIVELCSWSDRPELDEARVAKTLSEPWMSAEYCATQTN